MRFAHGNRVRNHGYVTVEDLDGNLERGSFPVWERQIPGLADAHIVIVLAAPDEGRGACPVLHMQFCRRGQLCSPAAAAETDIDKVVSVCESKALRCDEKALPESLNRQGIRPEQQRAIIPEFLVLTVCRAGNTGIHRLHRDGKAVSPLTVLRVADPGTFIAGRRLQCSTGIDIEITCAAHDDGGCEFSVRDMQHSFHNTEHGGTAVYCDGIVPVQKLLSRDRYHSVFHDVFHCGHLGGIRNRR